MSSYDLVVRIGFDVLPPDKWVAPASGTLHVPGSDSLPPLRFHRTERGVLACGAMGSRVLAMTSELDSWAREERSDDTTDELPMSLSELEASAKRVLGVDAPLRPASPDGPLDLRRFSGINSRIASRYQVGRVILVGDAAHVHSPIGGPGLNLGLQDAVNLGWKLAAVLSGRVGPALLATYETERRPAAERVIAPSRAQLALSSDRGLKSPRCANSSPNWSPNPANARRLSDLLSGAENRYVTSADAHPLVGRWVPDFAVTKRQRNKTRRGARPRRTAAAR